MNKREGISLIVLVITIIVIIILAGAVILSLSNNNPIAQATEASFKSNVSTYNSELSLYISKLYTDNIGSFDVSTFWANDQTSSIGVNTKITDIIKGMSQVDAQNYEIQAGKLSYIGTNDTEKQWVGQAGIGTSTILFENFEIGNIFTSGYTPTFARNVNGKKNESYGMQSLNDLTNYRQLYTSQNIYRSKNFEMSGWVRIDSGIGLTGLCFGVPDSGDRTGYEVIIDSRNSTSPGSTASFQIRRDYGVAILNSVYGPINIGEWYFIKVTWDLTGKIEAKYYNSSMVLVANLTATDTTYAKGHCGICAYSQSSFDDIKIIY